MTDMRIISVAIPDDLDRAILDIKKKEDYVRLTYSEVVRRLLYAGIGLPAPERKRDAAR